jgi:hypothetical protein
MLNIDCKIDDTKVEGDDLGRREQTGSSGTKEGNGG